MCFKTKLIYVNSIEIDSLKNVKITIMNIPDMSIPVIGDFTASSGLIFTDIEMENDLVILTANISDLS